MLALVQALNTGHDGSWSTCHANSAIDALHRLETLVIQAAPAWPLVAVRQHLTRSIDVVVHLARCAGGARRVVEVGEVVVDGDRLRLRPVVDGERGRRSDHAGADMSRAPTIGVVVFAVVGLAGARVGSWTTAPRRPLTIPGRARRTGPSRWPASRARRRPGDVEVAAWCERVAAGVRAGSSLTRAVGDADAATPAGRRPFPETELGLTRGRGLADAMGTVTDGPASAVGLLAPVMVAAAELGGPSAGALERVAGTLLARATEHEERRASSAQARLSARVLTILPFAVLGLLVLTEPSIRQTLATPAGLVCVVAGGVLNGLGWWWMHHVIGGVA